MNKARRKTLRDAHQLLEQARHVFVAARDAFDTALVECANDIEEVKDEEQEAFNNLHENIQGSDQGQRMEEVIQELEAAHERLEELQTALIELVDGVDEALTSIDNAQE